MKNKIGMSKSKKGFIKIPNKLLKMKLSNSAIMLYFICMSFPEKFNPSKSYLTSIIKISRWTINKAFKELIDRNIIKCIRVGNRTKVSEYMFIDIKDWK